MEEKENKKKSSLRKRADSIKEFRCKNLIAVLEEPNPNASQAETLEATYPLQNPTLV